MRLVKQFAIILWILFLGTLISDTFHLPIPGNVMGFVLLTVLLIVGVIKVEDIEEVATFFLNHLAVFFICPSVGIMLYLGVIKAQFVPIMIPTIASIMIGLGVTGKVVEYIIHRKDVDTDD